MPSAHDMERIGALSCSDFALAAPANVARSLGIGSRDYAGGVAVCAGALDVLTFNRVVGAGISEPLTEALLDEVVEWYASAGVRRFMVQPALLGPARNLPQSLLARGFVHHNSWAMLARGTDNCPDVLTEFRIEAIDRSGADAFAWLVATAFGMPATTVPWIASSVGRSGWRHYVAFDRQEPVAAGALFLQGEAGWLGFAATAAAYRGRGAQSALIARRIRDARDLGCKSLAVETAEDTPERPAPSFHNVRRLGFELVYIRPNFLLKTGAVAPGPA